MSCQDHRCTSGFALAVIAAGLAASGAPAHAKSKMAAASDKVDLVHCAGINACKGHNDCKTATNACKGQGSCKGQGFIALPKATCANIGGTAG